MKCWVCSVHEVYSLRHAVYSGHSSPDICFFCLLLLLTNQLFVVCSPHLISQNHCPSQTLGQGGKTCRWSIRDDTHRLITQIRHHMLLTCYEGRSELFGFRLLSNLRQWGWSNKQQTKIRVQNHLKLNSQNVKCIQIKKTSACCLSLSNLLPCVCCPLIMCPVSSCLVVYTVSTVLCPAQLPCSVGHRTQTWQILPDWKKYKYKHKMTDHSLDIWFENIWYIITSIGVIISILS